MSERLPEHVRPQLADRMGLSQEHLDLVRRTVAAECTDDELELFLHTASKYKLDPLLGEVHAIKRKQWNAEKKQYVERLTIQIGIDGYRARAEGTGRYCPGSSRFDVVDSGKDRDMCCTVTVYKLVDDGKGGGEWRPVEGTAWFSEYAVRIKGGDNAGKLVSMWQSRPKGMLEKCAETLAIRRAFPREVGGLRTDEEMGNAHHEEPETVETEAPGASLPPPPTSRPPEPEAEERSIYQPSKEQSARLTAILKKGKLGPSERALLVTALGDAETFDDYDDVLAAADRAASRATEKQEA